MKILFFGDIFGRSGRDALIKKLSYFKEKYAPDFILVNGENASHGKGISHSICNDLFSAGIDIITGGNHIFDNNDINYNMSMNTYEEIKKADFVSGTGCEATAGILALAPLQGKADKVIIDVKDYKRKNTWAKRFSNNN